MASQNLTRAGRKCFTSVALRPPYLASDLRDVRDITGADGGTIHSAARVTARVW